MTPETIIEYAMAGVIVVLVVGIFPPLALVLWKYALDIWRGKL